MKLEEWAEKRIQSIPSTVNRIIQFHPQKCRYTLDASMENDTSVIIKLNNTEMVKQTQLLNGERNYYKNHPNCSYLPKLIYDENGLLIIENIQGKTLLDFLENDGELSISELSRILTEMKKTRTDGIDTDLFLEYAFRRFAILLSSGFFNKHDKTSSALKNVKVILWKILKITMYRQLKKISKKIPIQCVHGDLHLNNILINEEGKLYVIDWENYGSGVFLLDCAALYGQIAVWLVQNRKQDVLEAMRLIFIEDNTEQYFVSLARICEALVALNPRFFTEKERHEVYLIKLFKLIKAVVLFDFSVAPSCGIE